MRRPALRYPFHIATVVGTFLILRFAMFANGLRFQADPPGQIHLLDLSELRADPFLAFTSLHIQPPLFNFFVGSVLRWSPFATGISFQVLYLLAGLGTILVLWFLLVDLGARPVIATVAATLVGWSPLLIRNENVLTYETPTALILVLSAWTFLRYVRRPGTVRLALFTATLVVGVLTRTTLNPLWFLGALVLVMVAGRPWRQWRPRLAVAGFAVLVVAVPLVHNVMRFETYGFSSFLGMNLERTTVMQLSESELNRLVDEEKVSRAALIRPYASYRAYAALFPPCSADTGQPVLDNVTKSHSWDRNMNSLCYLPVYLQARRDSVAVLRERPGVYAAAVARSARIYSSWDVHTADPDNGLWDTWVAVYAPLTGPVRVTHSLGGSDPQTFTAQLTGLVNRNRFSVTVMLSLLLSVGYGIRGLARILGRRADAVDWTRTYIAYTVVGVSLVGVLFDSFENARFREPLDPLLLGPLYVLVLTGLGRAVRFVQGRLGPSVDRLG